MKYKDYAIIAIVAVATWVVCMNTVVSCRCGDTVTPGPDTSSTAPVVLVTAAPSSTATETVLAADDYMRWPVVSAPGLKKVRGWWGDDEASAGALVESRDDNVALDMDKAWSCPGYPWHLVLNIPEVSDPYDCGFFEDPDVTGWRTAYCMGGDLGSPRTAHRLMLRFKEEPAVIYISLDNNTFLALNRTSEFRRPDR